MDYDFRCKVLNDWFVEGIHRGARYVVVVFDLVEREERPIFVFPEQSIQVEVVKQVNDMSVELRGVVDLLDDVDKQITAINIPDNILVSRVVN